MFDKFEIENNIVKLRDVIQFIIYTYPMEAALVVQATVNAFKSLFESDSDSDDDELESELLLSKLVRSRKRRRRCNARVPTRVKVFVEVTLPKYTDETFDTYPLVLCIIAVNLGNYYQVYDSAARCAKSDARVCELSTDQKVRTFYSQF
jgi:hypothetical protein